MKRRKERRREEGKAGRKRDCCHFWREVVFQLKETQRVSMLQGRGKRM